MDSPVILGFRATMAQCDCPWGKKAWEEKQETHLFGGSSSNSINSYFFVDSLVVFIFYLEFFNQ